MPHYFSDLQNALSTYLDNKKIAVIHKAYQLAEQAHKGQHRRSGDPYITHPIAVASILCQMQMDYESIAAAILHDVTEDTTIQNIQIIEEFGTEIAELVEGVSKLTHIPFESQAQAQAENFRKMTLAMVRDIRVILIKLADRLHNMRTLSAMPLDKKQRIARETLEIYAPIAARLGIHSLSIELEDLCFITLYPTRYRIIKEVIHKMNQARKQTIGHIETQIKNLFEQNELPPCAVWHQQPHLYAIYQKMKKEQLRFGEMIIGLDFCIVTDTVDTCYRVLGILHSLYKPLPKHFKDYIALPKANGYQSLHTTLFGPHGIPIKIQIRTIDMDQVAENGITAFGFNRPPETLSEAQTRASQWLKGLMEIQKNTSSSLEFIENVKNDLFPTEIYVFTPRGKIMELPHGATPIDFAYAVHSDIGNSCIAAKIDRKLAPLSTVLLNGQTVEIITASDIFPQESWLNFAITGKARSNIRHALKEKKRTDSISLGKKLLENALSTQGSKLKSISKSKMHSILKQFEYQSAEALYHAIGLGKQIAPLIAQRLLNELNDTTADLLNETEPYIIEGSEGIVINFAECCRPIPKDPIAGVLTINKGIAVHHESCKNLNKWRRRPGRYLPLNWAKQITETFKVELDIEVNNQQGMIANVTAKIAEAKVNIENISVKQTDNYHAIIHLLLSVEDRIHLAKIIRRIRLIKGVTRVIRSK